MNSPTSQPAAPLFPIDFLEALADDLAQLICLHDRELGATLIQTLKENGFPGNLAFDIDDEALANGFRAAVNDLPTDAQGLDLLAADFAGIYLTCSYGASPYESVWVTEEHLTCDFPMFELRQRYADAGLMVANQNERYDDHFALQLQFLEFRLRQAIKTGGVADWKMLAGELDEHILFWFSDFAARVANQCHTPFYALLVTYTNAWLERFRNLLADMGNLPRPDKETIKALVDKKAALDRGELSPVKFFPGKDGPSW